MTDDNKAFSLAKDLIVTVDGYYDKFTWNAAIEAAAKAADDAAGQIASNAVRKLKR